MNQNLEQTASAAAYDVIVVGGGLVGAACALAMSQQKLAVALVESRDEMLTGSPELDSRIYAISPGNAAWLEALDVWNRIAPHRICPIENMQVHGDEPQARIEFDAYEAHVGRLGYIVEDGMLQQALWQRLQQSDVKLLTGAVCTWASWQEGQAELSLENGLVLTAKLLVAADGAGSWLRAQAGTAVTKQDYKQMAVVANFEAALPHSKIARQWFRRDGVLAWLPLPEQRISMVWSAPESHARKLLALDRQSLAQAVAAAGDNELGTLETITEARTFPLGLQMAQDMVKPRLALIGDAAHVIHPLAGQGVNLGFRDAAALAQTFAQRNLRQDPGDYMLLRRYERARKTDIMAARYLTDGLYRLFASEQPVLARFRNRGLQVVERLSLVKRRLIQQAML